MPEHVDEITQWLEQVKVGDRAGVGELFDRYFHRLVALAASRLRSQSELAGYEEDVALSAFKSLCLGAERGRYPELANRDELWRLLAVITVRKSIDLSRRKRVQRKEGEEVLESILAREPLPDEVAEVSEAAEKLLDALGDSELKRIALLKVEGYTNNEIAKALGCAERTIERKLQQIRMIWQRVASDE